MVDQGAAAGARLADSFVEEGSITNNISTLRKILNPHFDGDPITTVARRGYRFSAAVRLRSVGAEISLVSEAPPPVPAAPRLTTRTRAVAIAALMVIVAIAGGLALRVTGDAQTSATAPGSRRSIAVLPMKNLSGSAEHAWFSTALTDGIAGELGAGGQLRLISGENVFAMRHDLAPPGVGLSRKQLNEIGETLGCDLVLTGDYGLSGGRLRVAVRLDDIASGQPIASLSVEEPETKLLDLVAARQPRAACETRNRVAVRRPERCGARALIVESERAAVLFPRPRRGPIARRRALPPALRTPLPKITLRVGAYGAVECVSHDGPGRCASRKRTAHRRCRPAWRAKPVVGRARTTRPHPTGRRPSKNIRRCGISSRTTPPTA